MARGEPALWLSDLNTADLLSLSFPSKLCPRSLQGADGPAPACVSANVEAPGHYSPILHPFLPKGRDPLGDLPPSLLAGGNPVTDACLSWFLLSPRSWPAEDASWLGEDFGEVRERAKGIPKLTVHHPQGRL